MCGSNQSKDHKDLKDGYNMNGKTAGSISGNNNKGNPNAPTKEGNPAYNMSNSSSTIPTSPQKDGGDYRMKFFERIRQLSNQRPIFKQQDPQSVQAALKELESDIWEDNMALEAKTTNEKPADPKTPENPQQPANGHPPVSTIANSGSAGDKTGQKSSNDGLAAEQVKINTGTGSIINKGASKLPEDKDGAGSVGSAKQQLVDREVVKVDPKSQVKDIEGGRPNSGHQGMNSTPAAGPKISVPEMVVNNTPAGGFTSIVLSGVEEYKKIIKGATQVMLKDEGYLQVTEKFKTYAPSLEIGRELKRLMRGYLRKQLTPLFAQMQQSNVSSASLVMSNLDEKIFVRKVLSDMENHLKELHPNTGVPDEQQTAGRLVQMRIELERSVKEKEVLVFGISSEGDDPFATVGFGAPTTNTNTNQPPTRAAEDL